MEESAMVSSAIHSPFASHRRSRPVRDAESSRRGALPDVLAAARVKGGSRPPLSCPSAPLLPALLLAPGKKVLHAPVADNGTSAPRFDECAATKTSPE